MKGAYGTQEFVDRLRTCIGRNKHGSLLFRKTCLLCGKEFEGTKERKFCCLSCGTTYCNRQKGLNNKSVRRTPDDWHNEHPEARKAENLVQSEIRAGRLTPGKCEYCGASKNIPLITKTIQSLWK